MSAVRIGFSTLGNASWRRPLQVAAELPVDLVEYTLNDFPADELDASAAELHRRAGELELELVTHLPHGSPDHRVGSSDDETRAASVDTFKTALDATAAIGAETAVLHVDAADHRLLLEVDRWDDLVAVVDHLATYAGERGVTLCVENMRGTTRRRLAPDDVATIASETRAGMTLDTGHARTMGYSNDDIVAFVKRYGEHIEHVHLNDTRGHRDDHLPFGAGTTAFQRIFEAFPQEWSGTFTLEVNVPDYEYIEISVNQLLDLLATSELDVTAH